MDQASRWGGASAVLVWAAMAVAMGDQGALGPGEAAPGAGAAASFAPVAEPTDASEFAEAGTDDADAGGPTVAPDEAGPAGPSEEGSSSLSLAEPPSGENVAATVVAAEPAPGGLTAPQACRCRVKLDVTGELIAPAGRGVPAVRQPIRLDARFDFEERAVPETGAASRVYTDAVADMRIGDEQSRRFLAADARRVMVARQAAAVVPYLEDAFFTSDERDLIDVPFDGLLIAGLLPDGVVAAGATWNVSADLVAGLLAIDTVESGAIVARLDEVVDGLARVTLSGTVDGGVDGVPTRIDVTGSLAAAAVEVIDSTPSEVAPAQDTAIPQEGSRRYDVRRRVDHASVVMHERRQAGHIAPGFDVEARIVIARSTVAGDRDHRPERATHEGLTDRRRGAGADGRLWYRDAEGRFDFLHDARWRIVEEGDAGCVMRLVDHGALVGQCSVMATAAALSEPPTTAAVAEEIERSLAGQITRVDEAVSERRMDGTQVVRVASSGEAERLPFRWVHYVLVSPRGGRIDVTFMVQESMWQRFADADRDLVASLVAPAGGAQAAAAAETADPAQAREARLPAPSPAVAGPR